MKRLSACVLACLPVLAACGEDPTSDAGPLASGTTYYQDAKPIFDAKCVSCHTSGGIAPFSLEDYDTARAYAAGIKADVQSKIMPPWLAAPGCADYLADRSLTDEQIALLSAWADGGAAEGDASKPGPSLETGPSRALSRVDVSLQMEDEYTARVEPDDYHCFILDWPEAEAMYVTGFRANPGNAQVVHHVIAFLAGPDRLDDVKALDDAEAGPGYTCYGGPGFRSDWLGAWAPGGQGTDFPAGTGLKVEPGSKVVLQVHYNSDTAGIQPDRTSADFKLDKTVDKEAWIQPFAKPSWIQGESMAIPAGTDDVVHSFALDPTKYFSAGKPITVYSAGLHMHTLGHSASVDIKRADGSNECMVHIPEWDFHWQGSYDFQQPKVMQPGDEISLECHWDNTTDRDVFWGEGTSDEMCLSVLYLSE